MIDLPVGVWVEAVVDFLRENVSAVFDGVAAVTLALANAIYLVLVLPHPLVVIAVLAGLTALGTRRWLPPVLAVAGFLLILAMQLWEATVQTLAVVILASIVAVAIGIPIGIAAARVDRVRTLIRPVLDFMQTLPVFVHLLPAVFFFGIGVVPGVVATTIFAIPRQCG